MSSDVPKRRSWNPAAFSSFKSDILSSSPPHSSSARNSMYSDSSLLMSPSSLATSPPHSRPSSLLIDSAFDPSDALLANSAPGMPEKLAFKSNHQHTSSLPTSSLHAKLASSDSNNSYSFPKALANETLISTPTATSVPAQTLHSFEKANLTRSLHISPPSKRWSSSSSSSSTLDSNNPRIGSPNSTCTTPSQWMFPDEERALQFKLQELARTENARLKAHEDLYLSTTSPTTKTPSDPFAPHLPPSSATPSSALPFKRSNASMHQRHLSLQPYYDSNHEAPEMPVGSPTRNLPGTSTSSMGFHFPLQSSPVHKYPFASSHRHSNSVNSVTNVSASNHAMSPRAVARAATLATLNSSESDPSYSIPNQVGHPARANSKHQILTPLQTPFGSRHNGSSSGRSSISELPLGAAPISGTGASNVGTQFATFNSEASIPKLLHPSPLGKRREKLCNNKSLEKNRLNEYSPQQPQQQEAQTQHVPSQPGVALPEGYYIISAEELEKLGAKVDENNNVVVEPGLEIEQPATQDPHVTKDVKEANDNKDEDIKQAEDAPNDTETSSKSSPSSQYLDIFSLFWALVSTSETSKNKNENDKVEEPFQSSVSDKTSDKHKAVLQVYDAVRQAGLYRSLESLKLTRNSMVSAFGTGCVMSIIFVQVSLLSIMVIAYMLGNILATPVSKGVELVTSYKLRRAQQKVAQKKLARKQAHDQALKMKHATEENSSATEAVEAETVNEKKDQQEEQAAAEVKAEATQDNTKGNNDVQDKPIHHNKPIRKGKYDPEYIDPSVLFSNTLKAKRAALKQAKRRSKR